LIKDRCLSLSLSLSARITSELGLFDVGSKLVAKTPRNSRKVNLILYGAIIARKTLFTVHTNYIVGLMLKNRF
jgi:hypothetical protein